MKLPTFSQVKAALVVVRNAVADVADRTDQVQLNTGWTAVTLNRRPPEPPPERCPGPPSARTRPGRCLAHAAEAAR